MFFYLVYDVGDVFGGSDPHLPFCVYYGFVPLWAQGIMRPGAYTEAPGFDIGYGFVILEMDLQARHEPVG